MISYFDDGGSVSGDSSGIAALPTISSSAQNAFNTAMANAGTASASQAAVQPFNTAQQGVGSLSNQAFQYSAPYGIGSLPTSSLFDVSKFAQNVGGQFADPYQNYIMYHGAQSDVPAMLAQYKAGGGQGTPDWAQPNARFDVLSTKWDASGSNAVPYLQAWNRTVPTTDIAPQGYWDALDAYNTGMSLWNPQTSIGLNQYDPQQYNNYNAAAYNAMNQGIYDRNSPVYQNYGAIPTEGSHGNIPNAGWINSYGASGI